MSKSNIIFIPYLNIMRDQYQFR